MAAITLDADTIRRYIGDDAPASTYGLTEAQRQMVLDADDADLEDALTPTPEFWVQVCDMIVTALDDLTTTAATTA